MCACVCVCVCILCIVTVEPLSKLCISFFLKLIYFTFFIADNISISMYTMCVIGWFRRGVCVCVTFAQQRLSPLAAFTSGAYFLHNDSEFENFTLPTLKTSLEARSQNLSGNKQSFVARAIGCPKTHFFHKLAIFWSAKKQCKDTVLHLPSPFPDNFCNCNSAGICTASQF